MVVCSTVDRAAIKSGVGCRWLVMGGLLVKVELSGSDEGCLESDTPRLPLLATILKAADSRYKDQEGCEEVARACGE